MDAIKKRKRHSEMMAGERERQPEKQTERQTAKRLSTNKILEVAFWGTVIWGTIRLTAHFLNLTPYGLGAYARPFMGVEGDNAFESIALGALVLFLESLLAAVLYAGLFHKTRIWWSGLLYGVMLLAVAGFFFRMQNWEIATIYTEGAWFLSYGLFIGMTLTLEQSDDRY